jgi:predicted DNA-binding transcriptional regulator AlpA
LRPLRLRDLCGELALVNNWTTLNNWIRTRGFPPGHMVGRCRMWTDREVFAWIESQPTENPTPLKGHTKRARAEANARHASNTGAAR